MTRQDGDEGGELMDDGSDMVRGRARALDGVGLVARLILGITLLVAGFAKVGDPIGSARAVQAYQMLPFETAKWFGYLQPYVEIILGVLLIVGLFTRAAALVGGLLMAAFVFGISWAWAKGLTIECGCFGGGGQIAQADTQYPLHIARDVGLVACAAWLVVRPGSFLGLDRAWFDPVEPDREADVTAGLTR